METKTQKPENGSSIRAVESNGTQAAEQISDRDLKILSHEYVGECDGILYFRNPLKAGILARGDESDKERLIEMQAKYPMIDAMTAAAALRIREMAATKTPFGTLAGDMVGS